MEKLILRKPPFYTEQLLYKHFFRSFNPFRDISLYSVRGNTLCVCVCARVRACVRVCMYICIYIKVINLVSACIIYIYTHT